VCDLSFVPLFCSCYVVSALDLEIFNLGLDVAGLVNIPENSSTPSSVQQTLPQQ